MPPELLAKIRDWGDRVEKVITKYLGKPHLLRFRQRGGKAIPETGFEGFGRVTLKLEEFLKELTSR